MSKHRITKVWVDDTHVYAMTEIGLTANYAFPNGLSLQKLQENKEKIINFLILAYIGHR